MFRVFVLFRGFRLFRVVGLEFIMFFGGLWDGLTRPIASEIFKSLPYTDALYDFEHLHYHLELWASFRREVYTTP